MKNEIVNSESVQYFYGGLAEVVNRPTPQTFKYFQTWFTGSTSVGRAMKLLNLPFQNVDVPILELQAGEVVVNLSNEEKTLYAATIFKYKKTLTHTPQLGVNWLKLCNPFYWPATFRIVLTQSQWIAHPTVYIEQINQLLLQLNTDLKNNERRTLPELEKYLWHDVWPAVIAVGMIAEFYQRYLQQESNQFASQVEEYCSAKIAESDWFFKSITDQQLVKTGRLTLTEFMKSYGLRADNDYELTCPRWHEIPELLSKRIAESPNMPPKKIQTVQTTVTLPKHLLTISNTYCTLQLLRTEAKRVALFYMDQLRGNLLTEKRILPSSEENQTTIYTNAAAQSTLLESVPRSGTGRPVAPGEVTGQAVHITSNEQTIAAGTIGIFPNASPQFAAQYAKCIGLIFLKGGQTSHGAIVAREFRIPAIIEYSAAALKTGTQVQLTATQGTWRSL